MDIFLGTLFIVICILLVLVVLLQRGRGGGLSAAFGGGGGASGAFGTKTGDVFTWVTIILTALFLLLAIGTNLAFRPPERQVETPVFRPAPEEDPNPKEVEISSPTQGAKIRFTLDGTEPTADTGTEYVIAIELEEFPANIKARAFREGYTPSEVATAFYPGAPGAEPEQPEPEDAENGEDADEGDDGEGAEDGEENGEGDEPVTSPTDGEPTGETSEPETPATPTETDE